MLKPAITTLTNTLARRIAQGLPSASGSADLTVYDSFLRGGER